VDRQIQACRPDLVVIDKKTKEGLIIDVAIPNDTHIIEKGEDRKVLGPEVRNESENMEHQS